MPSYMSKGWELLLKLWLASVPFVLGAILAFGVWIVKNNKEQDERLLKVEEWRRLIGEPQLQKMLDGQEDIKRRLDKIHASALMREREALYVRKMISGESEHDYVIYN